MIEHSMKLDLTKGAKAEDLREFLKQLPSEAELTTMVMDQESEIIILLEARWKGVKKKRMAPVSEGQIEEWRQCLKEGMGYKNVSEVYGVSPKIIRRHLPGMGMSHKEVVGMALATRNANRKMAKL